MDTTFRVTRGATSFKNKELFGKQPQPGDSDYSENDDDLEEERKLKALVKQEVNLKR